MHNGGIQAGHSFGGLKSPGEARCSRKDSSSLESQLNSEVERKVHLKCIHLEQVQHCIDMPLQVTRPTNTEQGTIVNEHCRSSEVEVEVE